jgi:ubiquinone/menaquinone biosynthesis C-methylase UbiE
MAIDFDKVASIIRQFQGLGPHEAYYLKDLAQYELTGPLVPDTEEILRPAFSHSNNVLDIGCGRGKTLIDNAHLFAHGVGLDESEDHMIAYAIRARDEKAITNLDFQVGKALNLPFEDNSFDMVFSERGPLGYYDDTLEEALRVLQPEGLIFVETLGGLDALQAEQARFEAHNISLQTLVVSRNSLLFKDFYELLKYQCSGWIYMSEALPSPTDRDFFEDLLAQSTDDRGNICIPYRTIWIAGSLKA